MSNIAAVTLLLLSAPSAGVVDRVVVFSDRAEVVRKASAACRNGRAEVELTGLPLSLDARTFQAQTKTGNKVLGISTRVEKMCIRDSLPAAWWTE